MAENYEIIAGRIKEKIEPKRTGTRPVETVIHKQELFGVGELKAQQVRKEEVEAVKAAEATKELSLSEMSLSDSIAAKESKKAKRDDLLI